MSLHNEIMNLPTRFSRGEFENEVNYLRYKEGHRDARHDAAVISMQGDRAFYLLNQMYEAVKYLPNKDWLDPSLERAVKGFLEEVK